MNLAQWKSKLSELLDLLIKSCTMEARSLERALDDKSLNLKEKALSRFYINQFRPKAKENRIYIRGEFANLSV